MTPEMDDLESSTSNDALDALEGRLGIRLPVEYRRWLLRFNGGRPWPGVFQYQYESGARMEGQVAWFWAADDRQSSNFEDKYRFWKITTNRLPGNLVSIAGDGLGDHICLMFDGPAKGKVYFWDLERETDPPSFANCYLVADTFDEFIAALAQPVRGEAEEKAGERSAILFGPFPKSVERQCMLIEAEYPSVRRWIRTISLSLFESKHQNFCFYRDPLSLAFLDMVFWLKQSADGAASLHVSAGESRTIEEWKREQQGGFGIMGYAPQFVVDWAADRLLKGIITQDEQGIELTPDGISKTIEEIRRLAGD